MFYPIPYPCNGGIPCLPTRGCSKSPVKMTHRISSLACFSAAHVLFAYIPLLKATPPRSSRSFLTSILNTHYSCSGNLSYVHSAFIRVPSSQQLRLSVTLQQSLLLFLIHFICYIYLFYNTKKPLYG